MPSTSSSVIPFLILSALDALICHPGADRAEMIQIAQAAPRKPENATTNTRIGRPFQIVASDSFAAARVCRMCSSVCTDIRNAASNWLHGR